MIERANQLLRAGELVAIPTETVYGLAADATNPHAVAKIFALKGRPATNPLIAHVASIEIARRYAADWPAAAELLAQRFWPGPLTIVLPRSPLIADNVVAGGSTVGLRVPDHPLTLDLLSRFDGPLAAPSANRSNHVSPTTAAHVRDEFGDAVLIVDGGPCRVGIESAVVDVTGGAWKVLRPGTITTDMIQTALAPLSQQGSAMIVFNTAEETVRSPGQLPVHYAPRTPAFRFDALQRTLIDLGDAAIIDLTLDPETYARNLYARLRLLDTQSLRAIYIELPPDSLAWRAVRDRVIRATRPLDR